MREQKKSKKGFFIFELRSESDPDTYQNENAPNPQLTLV